MDRYPKFDPSRNELPSDRRVNKRMTDDGRVVIGKQPIYEDFEKVSLISDAASRIEKLIDNSDVNKPYIRRKIEDLILADLVSGEITELEAEALLYHIEATAEYQTEVTPNQRDFREVQFKD